MLFAALLSEAIGVLGICCTSCTSVIRFIGMCCTSCLGSGPGAGVPGLGLVPMLGLGSPGPQPRLGRRARAPAPGSSAGPAQRLRAQAWRPGPAPRPKPQAWRLGILTVGFLRAFLGFQCLPMGFSIFASGIHFRVGFSNGISPCLN